MGFMTGLGGFSEGFGKAFSNSFSEARQLSARAKEKKDDRENDIFLQTMKDNQETMEAMAKAEAKDRAIVTKGKALTTAFGLDAKTSAQITQMLRDTGGDSTEIETLLKNGTFTSSAANNITTNSTVNSVRSNAASNQLPGLDEDKAGLDTQTDSAMGITPDDGVATQPLISAPPAPSAIDMGDGISYTRNPPKVDYNQQENVAKSELVDAMARGDANAEAAARAKLNRMQSANEELNPPSVTGRTQFDVQDQLSRALASNDQAEAIRLQGVLTQANTAEANSKTIAQGAQPIVSVNPDGSKQVTIGIPKQGPNGEVEYEDQTGNVLVGARTQTKEERDEIQRITDKAMGPERDKQVTRITDAGAALSSASKLVKMVDTEKGVLDNVVGGVASFVDQGLSELKTAGDLLGVEIEQNGEGVTAESMAALEQRVEQLKTQPISDLAQRQALFNAELGILAYRAGAAEGQTGQAFTEKDFGRIQNALRGNTNDPTTFKSALSNYMSGVISRIDNQTKVMTENNPMINQFEKIYGYSPMEQVLPTMDGFITRQDDEDAKMGLQFVRENAGKNTIGSGAQQEQKQSTSTIPSGAANLLRSKPELRDQFDAKYGKGAAASVLGQ